MSAICGIWQRDGEPVSPQTIARMMDALAYRGTDGSGVWREGAVALGHQMRHITPESLHEQLPLHDPQTNLTLAADARIDNRAELFDLLQVSRDERLSITDSELILRAYKKYQDRCVAHLLGAFAFALWDAPRQRLLVAIDPIGEYALYYWHDARRFIFASEIKSILAAPDVPTRLHGKKLAALAYPLIDADDKTATLYKGVQHMPAATMITVTASSIQSFEYWKPDPTRRLPFKSASEIVEGMRATIFEAVRARTRSAFPVASLLSGGLDSSSVVAVASRILAETGRSLITLSAVVPENERTVTADDRHFIDEFRDYSNLARVFVTAEGRGPFDNIESLMQRANFPLHTSRQYLYTAFAEEARQRGARVILDGVGGEFGVGFYAEGLYAEWFRRGHWRTLWRELNTVGQGDPRRMWGLARNEVVSPLVPNIVRRMRGQGLKSPWMSWGLRGIVQSEFAMPYWEAQRQQWLARMASASRILPDHRQNQVNALTVRAGVGMHNFVGDEWVQLPAPFLDKRVLEYALAAPGELKRMNGQPRYLQRASMEGILPPAIQWRRSKQAFSPDYAARYNRQRPQIYEWLGAISPTDPIRALVNVEALQNLAAQEYAVNESVHTPRNYAALQTVPTGVYLVHLLRQFPELR